MILANPYFEELEGFDFFTLGTAEDSSLAIFISKPYTCNVSRSKLTEPATHDDIVTNSVNPKTFIFEKSLIIIFPENLTMTNVTKMRLDTRQKIKD
jgi:hypothetical protein